ncbi:putative MATE family efflux protein [Sinobacterium caligoides]|uniref:Multidrug-efflux transporter n=1 Tax=Sinobacterium caligoides TaxID=933926 RepID=A0A3N2DJZ7_9GAMM|nr:MATE family efflux transporter [Sinobacterium caligoides]ROS00009.1 putative MATE family efflux protein [Sinobacterium caligoides]
MQLSQLRQLLILGLPISAGMLSQSLLSLVDISMVARLDDPDALAAVGIGSYASFLAVALIIGLSVGVQTLVARRWGEGKIEHCGRLLGDGLLLALLGGCLLTTVFWFSSDLIIGTLSNHPDVNAIANPYYDYRILSIVAVGLNFAFRGYWNGIKQPLTYLKILLVVHLCNFSISYCLIFGHLGFPKLGAPGSGLGTTISLYIGVFLYILTTWYHQEKPSFTISKQSLHNQLAILKLATPTSLQQMMVALGVSTLYWIIGQLGVAELAVTHAIINITLFIILPGTGMGIAATTLVSSELGKGLSHNAYQWGWDTVKVTAPLLALLGLPLVLFPHFILKIFLPSDPSLIELGTVPLQITGAFAFLQAFTLTIPQSLNGAGDNRRVMVYSIFLQWGIGLPLALLAAFVFKFGLIGIWSMQIIERIIASITYARRWRNKKWLEHKL